MLEVIGAQISNDEVGKQRLRTGGPTRFTPRDQPIGDVIRAGKGPDVTLEARHEVNLHVRRAAAGNEISHRYSEFLGLQSSCQGPADEARRPVGAD